MFGRGDSFVRKITGNPNVDRPLQRIREFRNRPTPGIVVTVDMLTTGVDIPDLEYIVFLRPVKSRILFTQMMGRGTRKGEHFPAKSHFVVFDCFDGSLLAYFKNTSDIAEDPPTGPTRKISEIIDDIWANRDTQYNTRCLTKRLQRIDKEMSGKAREEFAAFIPDGDIAEFARELPRRLKDDFTKTLALLRDPAFQELLVNYQRRDRFFLTANQTQDEVSSEWLVRGSDGVEYKPADYLTAFSEYVRAHEADIEAITVLLKRPRRWNPHTLQQLLEKLKAAPQRFTLDNLQRAHAHSEKKTHVRHHFDGEACRRPAESSAYGGGARGCGVHSHHGRSRLYGGAATLAGPHPYASWEKTCRWIRRTSNRSRSSPDTAAGAGR